MGWQSIQIVCVSACVIFILHQKILKMAKFTFWYQLTRVVPDKVQRVVKWLCVVCTDFLKISSTDERGERVQWVVSFTRMLESCLLEL